MTKRLLVFLLAATAMALPAAAFADSSLDDLDERAGSIEPTAKQQKAAERLGASVRWNRYGTPQSLGKPGGFLAKEVDGDNAAEAAREFLDDNRELFRPGSLKTLTLHSSIPLSRSDGHAVVFRQQFGSLAAAEGGLVTVGLGRAGDDDDEWNVAYLSSSLTGDGSLAAQPQLSAVQAWASAAANVGHAVSLLQIGKAKADRGWSVFGVQGLAQPQRSRLVAVPTYTGGVRPAFETLFVDQAGGSTTAFQSYVDAVTGDVLIRKNVVEQSHAPAQTFAGSVPQTDGACGPRHALGTVAAPDERIGSVVVAVEATVTANDSVIHLYRDGVLVATQDTLASPEALVYDPPDSGQGTYETEVCDFADGAAWVTPATYTGQAVFNPANAQAGLPYPPKWKVFPNIPLLGGDAFPYNNPNTDIRETWCWESTVGQPPVTLPECDREVQNLASRVPWDFSPRTNTPTFTTTGNNANTAEAWTSPLTPGATAYRPVALDREYIYPWTNVWHTSDCFTPFVPGQSHDVSAAVTNLFVMHNRMHDWSYFLGFTERAFNAQESNFGTGGTAENDSVIGNTQAGALDGGFPSYLGRDNANMIALPDGVRPITNMYLWQPLAGAFYAPCVDGDFDMAVVGHEYGHLIENRMIGKGGTRGGHHAGAMGESFGDLMAVEYLAEYGFSPVSGENPFAVGAYATGNKQSGIRSYGMNSSPLNFSDHGFDVTGAQVHADGEIWSATNFDIRQALVAKYGAGDPATQEACADGERPPDQCPGNRRWMQIVFDAYLLMPVAPSMLDARDAYLAADQMRFGGANQTELWRAFARRGFGEGAFSTNMLSNQNDTDPKPDFASPLEGETAVTFAAVAADEGNAPIASARVYVGHYEARVSPIADTDPATAAPAPGANNLDPAAGLVAGTYDLLVHAPGYGHVRLTRMFSGSGSQTVTVSMNTNRASTSKGAVASGDGTSHESLIDDTEGTNWDRTGAVPDVSGSTVTVDLQGGTQTVDRVNVSAMLLGENRFTALRQFEIRTCNAGAETCLPATGVGFSTIHTSPADAFPGSNPRPVAPALILRTFDVPNTEATHVQIRVLTNQCTGQPTFQGEQDADPLNSTDCRVGSPGAGPVVLIGDLPQVLAPRDNEVHIAELQVFGPAPVTVARPDLQVTDINVSGRGSGRPTATAVVANTGNAAAGASRTEFVFDGTRVLCLVDTPGIAAGASRTVTCRFQRQGAEGQHTITATADKAAQVTESNETNNSRTESFEFGD